MRVSLKRGSHAVEIDGTLAEVQEILSQWWAPDSAATMEDSDEDGETAGPAVSKPAKPRRRKAARKVESTSKDTFDPKAFANAIKEDAKFEKFREKIILGAANRTLRAKFVVWHADAPMTSGQVQKVLQALDVKIDNSSVSRGLSSARTDL